MGGRGAGALAAATALACLTTLSSCESVAWPEVQTDVSASTAESRSTPEPRSTASTLGTIEARALRADPDAPIDSFGVERLYPSAEDPMIWEADWSTDRTFSAADPKDPWFVTGGAGSYKALDDQLFISGNAPRMYVREPNLERQWRDVEITMYFKRVADDATPFAGMTAVARTNHGLTGNENEDLCDSRGIGARLRYDGRVDFEKESAHPNNDAAAGFSFWDVLPFNEWIGYKYVVYDLPDGTVKMELWLDRTGGKDGGTWTKINEIWDAGSLFGDEPCTSGIDPQLPLTNSPDRPGSESGLPNLGVYFRSDNVAEDGLIYKWGSVREITAPPTD